jgi:hypothetical protein
MSNTHEYPFYFSQGSGDSGAAVISKNTNQIIGILSYVKDAKDGQKTDNDCTANVPAVALRISSYLGWIGEKTGIQFEEDDESDESDESESDESDESESDGDEESDDDEEDDDSSF